MRTNDGSYLVFDPAHACVAVPFLARLVVKSDSEKRESQAHRRVCRKRFRRCLSALALSVDRGTNQTRRAQSERAPEIRLVHQTQSFKTLSARKFAVVEYLQ